MHKINVMCACVYLLVTLGSADALANDEVLVDYHVINQTSAEVLSGLEGIFEVDIEVMGSLRGRMRNVVLSGDLHSALTQFATANSAEWWRYGERYIVSTRPRSIRRIVDRNMSMNLIQNELDRTGIYSPGLGITKGDSYVVLSGPEELVEEVSTILQVMQVPEAKPNLKNIFVYKGGSRQVVTFTN